MFVAKGVFLEGSIMGVVIAVYVMVLVGDRIGVVRGGYEDRVTERVCHVHIFKEVFGGGKVVDVEAKAVFAWSVGTFNEGEELAWF